MPTPPTDDPTTLDATGQAHLVATGEITASELVDAALARIERSNPALNAIVHERAERARVEARGPLAGPFAGVPFVLKDLVAHSAGDPYHGGIAAAKARGWTAETDSDLVRRFKGAGFVLVGRGNTAELGNSFVTEPLAYGPTRNPWDLERTPGGSSGGSAAAVAAGMVPVAHGNDMGGSVRVPASFSGLVGLKGTRGRTSLGPGFGELHGPLAHEGILTRSVRDIAGVLDVIGHPSPGDPHFAPPPRRPYVDELGAGRPLRIGLLTADPAGAVTVEPAVGRALAQLGGVLEQLGHHVDTSHPAALAEDLSAPTMTVFAVAYVRHLEFWSQTLGVTLGPDDVEPPTWQVAARGRDISASDYVAALEALTAWSRRITTWWPDGGYDLLITPTTPRTAPPIGYAAPSLEPELLWQRLTPLGVFTSPFNVTGQPAISLPIGVDDAGLPIGAQLVAPFGREDLLIGLAHRLEAVYGWDRRRPEVGA